MNNSYSYLYCFEKTKKAVSPKKIKAAEDYLKSFDNKFDSANRASDRQIYKLSLSDEFNCDPILCLRCRVSKAIYNECKSIYEMNEDKVDLFDLLRFVLIDDGRNYLLVRNFYGKRQKYLINFSFLGNNLLNIKIPIFLEIIKTFDYERSNLRTWTRRIVRADIDIRNHLRERGVKFIKTWAKLADTSTKRIKNSLINYGINKSFLDEMIRLHESYKNIYKEAKKYHYARNKTQQGWEPTQEFLKSLDPPQENKKNLLLMEEALNFSFQPKLEFFDDKNFDEKIKDIGFSQDVNENELKIKSLIETIKKSSTEIIKEVLNEDKKKWMKDEERKKCWLLYSKGMSQREIAKKCNHKQGWVSKLIRENFLGELIANDVLISLKNKKEFENISKIPEELDYIKDLIRNQILSIEQITNRSFLMQIVEEELNK